MISSATVQSWQQSREWAPRVQDFVLEAVAFHKYFVSSHLKWAKDGTAEL